MKTMNKMSKKIVNSLKIIIVVTILFSVLSGCAPKELPLKNGIVVVCTIFPQYDWACEIIGDRTADIELILLSGGGTDFHNFQPSVDDIIKISTCDLFIYTGGESEKWVGKVLKDAINKDMIVINLSEKLNGAGHADEHDFEHDHDHDDLCDLDEHVWLSLKNAKNFCRVIADALLIIDPGSADEYLMNVESYVEKITALDSEYAAAVNSSPVKTFLFGDRFPFRFLADDYGINYYAAFNGCSAETETSFQTIVYLAKKMDELKLKNIMVTENADVSVAETIIKNSSDINRRILVMDSMQSVTSDDIKNGAKYYSIMKSNLNVLREALK